MQRSRPRRATTRRGRSREASPSSGNDDKGEWPVDKGASADPLPPRRSTRSRRGSPTPPQATNAHPAIDETDTTDGSGSQAQHVTNVPDAATAVGTEENDQNDKQGTNPDESDWLEQAEQCNAESTKPPTSPCDETVKSRSESPEKSSNTPEGDNEGKDESPPRELPKITQEEDIAMGGDTGGHGSGSTGSALQESRNVVKQNYDAASHETNGLGDDHAIHENENGKREVQPVDDSTMLRGVSAVKEHHPVSGTHVESTVDGFENASVDLEGASVRGDAMREASAMPTSFEKSEATTGESSIEIPLETTIVAEATNERSIDSIQAESRTVSLGSKSALDLIDNGNDDHEVSLKMSYSPGVSLDSLNGDQEKKPTTSGIASEANREETTITPPTSLAVAKDEEHSEEASPLASISDPPGDPHENLANNVGALVDEADATQGKRDVTDYSGSESNDVVDGEKSTHASPITTEEQVNEEQRGPVFSGTSRSTPSQKWRPAEHSAVTRDEFAVNVNPTTKGSSSASYLSGSQSETSRERVDAAESHKGSATNYTDSAGGRNSQVEDCTASLASRKRRLCDFATDATVSNSDEGAQDLKRRRNEFPLVVASTTQDSTRKHPLANGDKSAASTRAPRLFQSNATNVENVKIRLYDIAWRVHRSRGPERMFAAYWGALRRFLGYQLQQSTSTGARSPRLQGIQEVLDSFLTTRQMRKLHNLLIMGLLGDCARDSVKEDHVHDSLPEAWKERIRKQRVLAERATGAALPSVASDGRKSPVLDLSDFSLYSGVWTSAGREALTPPRQYEAESNSALVRSTEMSQLHRQSPCLPGALTVDPLVRRIIRESHIKVSESAIWLLIVAVREYTQSVLKDTITNLASVDSEQSLGPAAFAHYAIRSGNMGEAKDGRDVKKNDGLEEKAATKDKGPTNEKKAILQGNASPGGMKRRISALDIASALNGTRMSAESLSGSTTSLAYERCFHLSFNGSEPTVPLALDSVKAFFVHGIESAAKKPRHEWRDPNPIPIASPAQAAPSVEYPSPSPTHPSLRPSTAKDGSNTSSSNRHSPSGGLGKEGKGFATLKARTVSAAERAMATQSVLPSTPETTTLDTTKPAKHESGSNDCNGSPPPSEPTPGIFRHSASKSPQGVRGKGFGVKDLAAMRARSHSTESLSTASNRSSPSPNKKQQAMSDSTASPPSSSTPKKSSPQSNNHGKEVGRPAAAEQVKGQEAGAAQGANQSLPQASVSPKGNESSTPSGPPAGAGMSSTARVLPEPEAMDTSQ